VGAAIKEAIDTKVVTRDQLFVTSKLWNSFHEEDKVEPHLRETLAQLQLDYLDLYLIHWPVTHIKADTLTPSTEETWRAMERIHKIGLARSIGVSNFSSKKLRDMKRYATVFPAVNQVELHPLNRQDELLATCSELNVHLSAYSPLGSPDSSSGAAHAKQHGALIDSEVVVSIANEVKKPAANVLIRWAIQRGTSVLPKSVTPSRILSNFDALDWELSPEQFNRLNTIEPQIRIISGSFFVSPEGTYKTTASLWDE
jgi:alcohol dehydrogenase (NADP+)